MGVAAGSLSTGGREGIGEREKKGRRPGGVGLFVLVQGLIKCISQAQGLEGRESHGTKPFTSLPRLSRMYVLGFYL